MVALGKKLKKSFWRSLFREGTAREHIEKRMEYAKEVHEALKSLHNVGEMSLKYYEMNRDVFRQIGVGDYHVRRAANLLRDLKEVLHMLEERPQRQLDDVANRRFLLEHMKEFIDGPGYLAKLLEPVVGGIIISDSEKIAEELSRLSGASREGTEDLVKKIAMDQFRKNVIGLSLFSPEVARAVGDDRLRRFIEKHHEVMASFIRYYNSLLRSITGVKAGASLQRNH